MQESQSNKRIAMILLIVILLLIVPAYYMVYYRHRLYDRRRRERIQLDNIEFADDELRRMELEDNKLHVANNVLDNCLSALKHETMYYPSRIRQLVDKGDVGSLDEVTQYYRELYGLLSTQAVRQVEQVKLHVSHTTLWDTPVLGNENLLRYLVDILRPQHVEAHVKDDRYVVFTITRNEPLSDIDYLRCRQIIRDHGDATHRRACGITVTPQEIKVSFVTKSPRQKSSVLPTTSCRSGDSSRNSSPTLSCSTSDWAAPRLSASRYAVRPRRCIRRSRCSSSRVKYSTRNCGSTCSMQVLTASSSRAANC